MRDLHDAPAPAALSIGERYGDPHSGLGSPAEPAGGDFGGPATHVHAGGGDGARRAPEAACVLFKASAEGRFICTGDDAWRMALAQLDAIHAQANALARAEPPVPLRVTALGIQDFVRRAFDCGSVEQVTGLSHHAMALLLAEADSARLARAEAP